MPKISKSLMVGALAILILLVAYFGTFGQWQAYGEAKTALDASKKENDRLKQAQADANAFINKYENNRVLAEKASRALPVGDPDIPILLDNVSTLFKDSGLTVASFAIATQENSEIAKDPNSIQSIDINAEVKGSFEAYQGFLLRLQQNLRVMDLIGVTISGSEEGDSTNVGELLSFTLKLRTYYQK